MLLSEIEGRITMESKNYSAEAMVLENGKYVKGTLTLFIDEYVLQAKEQVLIGRMQLLSKVL